MNEIEFRIFEDPIRKKKIAQWKRAFGYDRETKQIFLPAIILGLSEMMVLMMISYDGQPIVTFKNHMYVPDNWILENTKNPEVIELVEKIQERAKDIFTDPE